MTSYKPRPIRFLELIDGSNHNAPNLRVKLYGVTAREGETRPGSEIIKAARAVAIDRLSAAQTQAIPESSLCIALAFIHEAKDGNYLMTAAWAYENVVLTQVSQIETVPEIKIIDFQGRTPLCTWELALLAFERNAWIERVLKNPTSAGIESYLSYTLNVDT